jgi:cobalt/nickel transport system permease protein
MHIPDGLLSLRVALICWVISLAVLTWTIRKTRGTLGERQIPLMGVMAAFIFAAQMINFPVAAGTSGHLLGGVLAAIALGPWSAILVMASVIIVQGLLFQDGGLLVMGANILNMGIITVVIGYGLYRLALSRPMRTRLIVAGVAAWISVIAGALATSLELWLSGTARLDLVIPAMLGVHALIGIGEALVTVAALSFLLRTRPDLIEASEGPRRGGKAWIAGGILLVALTALLTPLASVNPDGLNRVAINMGFIQQAQPSPIHLLGGYRLPLIGHTPLSTILAAILGMVVVVGIITLIARWVRAAGNNV